ncbi:succinate-semialdehyde dehydrogenase/glutarate-semialdehyde dehydrogenase [Sphingobium sp. OAS761]|uniref:NAD-dependent succinate-semialdehyde dehydrogenase n=1 Tax=Sphingobium sp. OAS761 TaxID=2817901 RepID=UPI00209EE452|nr:NAD-dependent succinate-semialdehyde dehydrogenase [Sphingobium sp. OAS761]MCP1471759.1 succinate-semialdehyde dehydrogenase/glutarate-semialdehyde dehydrogenase [Sphingobium sp. OAS761]
MTQTMPRPIIDGVERDTASLGRRALVNPATGETICEPPSCGAEEASEAARLSVEGFELWSAMSAFDRSKIMRRAAEQMRAEADEAAVEMTREGGKPLVQARAEWMASADLLDWYAEEGRRAYGRLIPTRAPDMRWAVHRRPVGPVAAFTPWNFPAWTPMQKVAPALAAGCSVVLKPAEETPSAGWRIVRALLAAGVPGKALSVIWGDPAAISSTLCAAPEIHKVTLTGSTRVGRILASAAGQHLKKVTMELGGHNPVIVARDADLDTVVPLSAEFKFRNAGQVCVSPTRFLVERPLYADFVAGVAEAAKKLKVGDGMDAATQMGPLSTAGQLSKIESLAADAVQHGAKVETGGSRIGNAGYFFEPTILSGMNPTMAAMNEEPFGPLMLVMPVDDIDAALVEANRLPYGLAAYAFTNSMSTERKIVAGIESGMLGINHFAMAMPETPFGGVGDSGMGSEGGIEGMDAYLRPFLVTAKVA